MSGHSAENGSHCMACGQALNIAPPRDGWGHVHRACYDAGAPVREAMAKALSAMTRDIPPASTDATGGA